MDRIKNRRRDVLLCALLAIVTLAAFSPVLRNDFVVYDDAHYITDNPHVLSGVSWANVRWAFTTGHAANWHPLTWLSHMLDMQLFGVRPGWHHLVSLLIHTANALMLFLLLQELTGACWRSLMVAALFALHPLHVESVAWAAERKDVLSAFFFLLTLGAYARYAASLQQPGASVAPAGETSAPASPGHSTLHTRPSTLYYLLALVLFACGLMSKPMLVTTPFVLLLLDVWPLRRLQPSPAPQRSSHLWRLVLEKLPFLCLAAASSVATYVAQREGHAVTLGLPLGLRLANAAASCAKYLGKALWPAHLSILYPHPYIGYVSPPIEPRFAESAALAPWQTWTIALLLVSVSLGALGLLKRRPWFAVGWFWYLGMLVPVLGLVQVGAQAMADRYTYLPLVGIFTCVVWGFASLASAQSGRNALTAAALAVLAACAFQTSRQTRCWRTDFELFSHALAVNPNNALAHCSVGAKLGNEGQVEVAMAHFRAALATEPNNTEALYCIGVVFERQGDTNAAAKQFEAALRQSPRHEDARVALGTAWRSLGRLQEGLEQYELALEFNPDNAKARYFLGRAFSDSGKLAEAEEQFALLVGLRPKEFEARDRLATTLLKEGKLAQAAVQFEQLVRFHPKDVQARINCGGALWRLGRHAEALLQYQEAVRLSPALPVAHYNLGTALLAQGRAVDAWVQLLEAVRLQPDYLEALSELGKVAVAQDQYAEAQARFRQVVRLCPTNASFQVNLGNALLLGGKTNEANESFATALRLEPGLTDKLVQAGKALVVQGQPDTAIARFRTALLLEPDNPAALNSLAWVLATHPLPRVRNGPEAVRLAERACASVAADARSWTTLAAAYAEAGRFGDALTAGEKARALATAAGDTPGAQAAEARLALYRQRKPFHQ